MQRATQRERFEFIHLMMKHTAPYPESEARWIAERLLYYGATLGRLAEQECNGWPTWINGRIEYNWNEAEAAKAEKKETKVRESVTKLCSKIGCKPVFQGDPRGNTLKIQVPDGYTNDWGHEGICVPTS